MAMFLEEEVTDQVIRSEEGRSGRSGGSCLEEPRNIDNKALVCGPASGGHLRGVDLMICGSGRKQSRQ